MQRRALRFGPFVLDTLDQSLVRGEERTVLQPKIFDLLRHLAEQAPRVVPRSELLDAVWDGVAVSDNTVDQALGKIRKALGDHRDLLETVPRRGWRLDTVVAQELLGDPDAARPESAPSLYGRARDLERIAALLADRQLVTLLGPGGIGKTTLANATLEAWGAGGRFVDLAACRTVVDVVGVVADLLQVPAQTGSGGLGESLAHAIASSGVSLWVLDNLEQISDTVAPLVATWAEAAPTARFLATSRQRLGLRHEAVAEIRPLGGDDAADLLRARVEELDVGLGQDLSDEDVHLVAEAVEGVPLALELAATRLLSADAAALVAELRSTLLEPGGPTHHPERQRSIENTLRWSWSLLPDWAADAAEQLSVFRAPFDAELAEAVLSLPAHAPAPLQALGALRSRSLVARERGTHRTRLLDSVRTFAGQALTEHGGRARAEEAHAVAVLGRVRRWLDYQPPSLPQAAREQVRPLVPELQAVLERMLEREDWEPAAGAALVLSRYYYPLGLYEEVERVLGAVAERAPLEGAVLGRLRIDHALATSRTRGTTAGIALLDALADALDPSLAELREARRLAVGHDAGEHVDEAAAELAERTDDPWIRALALQTSLASAARAGSLGLADLAREAATLAEATGDEALLLALLNSLYEHERRNGEIDAAQATLERGIRLAEEVGVPVSAAGMRVNLSNILSSRGQVDRAAATLEEADRIARRVGNRNLDAFIQLHTGVLWGEFRGDLERSRGHFDRARTIFRELGRLAFAAGSLNSEAVVAVYLGAPHEAIALAEQAIAEGPPGDALVRWRAELALSKAALSLGDPGRASAHALDGLSALGSGWPYVRPEFLSLAAAAAALDGRLDEAETLRAQAVETHTEDDPGWVPLLLGLVDAAAGDDGPARRAMASAPLTHMSMRWARAVTQTALEGLATARGPDRPEPPPRSR